MSILAIDWWKKRIWVAYATWLHAIVFPIGSLDNTPDVLYKLAHIVGERMVSRIIIGCPSEISKTSKAIDAFVTQLKFVLSPDITIEKVNEDYTSIQAGERLWQFTKTAAEDTVAAAIMLEQYLAWRKNTD